MNESEDKKRLDEEIEKEIERRLQERLAELRAQITEEVLREVKERTPDFVEKREAVEPQVIPEKVEKEIKEGGAEEEEEFLRFPLNFRIQHFIMLVSVILLIITGLPLKFENYAVSQFVIRMIGGTRGHSVALHHLAAMALIYVGIHHFLYIIFSKQGRKDFIELLPRRKDFSDLAKQIKYFLGFSKERAKFGRFSYIEKFDYWAVYWGMVVMIGSGLIMWLFRGNFELPLVGKVNLPFGPGSITLYVHNIAKEAHSDEALLATLAIIIWHFYNVHLNPHKFPMSFTWITGKISRKEILEEHPLELEKILEERKRAAEKKSETSSGRKPEVGSQKSEGVEP